jgi:hypothetical protein
VFAAFRTDAAGIASRVELRRGDMQALELPDAKLEERDDSLGVVVGADVEEGLVSERAVRRFAYPGHGLTTATP